MWHQHQQATTTYTKKKEVGGDDSEACQKREKCKGWARWRKWKEIPSHITQSSNFNTKPANFVKSVSSTYHLTNTSFLSILGYLFSNLCDKKY